MADQRGAAIESPPAKLQPRNDASRKPVVLVVEDDANMRGLIVNILGRMQRAIKVRAFESSDAALDFIEHNEVAVLVTDLRMPGADGLEVLRFAKRTDSSTQVVLITGYPTVGSAVEALKDGAYDYIGKPFETVELRCTVERALDYYLLSRQNRQSTIPPVLGPDDDLIGESQAMVQVKRLAAVAGDYDCGVLLSAQSGCGKELVARQIHSCTTRRSGPFVAINCAAIPETLIETELFGYKQGAFTGAERSKRGLFEMADGGTLFLDEVNHASPALQVKLLRVLQDGTFYPMGETELKTVDVRVIAASNQNIAELIEAGSFREDLYYRLKVVEITIPPLHERREDIALLTRRFIAKFARRLNKHVTGASTAVLGAFLRYHWPGNVRELESVVQRMVIMAQCEKLDVEVLPPELLLARTGQSRYRTLEYIAPQSLDEIEASFIRKTLRETKGDRALSAEILGIDKSTLWRKIKRYGLEA